MTTTTPKRKKLQDASADEIQYCHDYFEQLFRTNFFKCLDDETRQRIILLTGLAGEEGMCVAEIAGHFNLDRTTISHHLTMLRNNNLLEVTKRGKERHYRVNVDYLIGAVEEVARILKACCK